MGAQLGAPSITHDLLKIVTQFLLYRSTVTLEKSILFTLSLVVRCAIGWYVNVLNLPIGDH